jgi:hypothetical protein
MPQLIKPVKLKVDPKNGEIEITLNININLDGKMSANSDDAKVSIDEEEDKVSHFIPDFGSGMKLNFGKKE